MFPCDSVLVPVLDLFPVLGPFLVLGLFPALGLLFPILGLCSLYDIGQSHRHPRNDTIPFVDLPEPYMVVFARARLFSCTWPNHSSAVPATSYRFTTTLHL